MNEALHKVRVPSLIAQRRDDFLSPEFRWLVATLKQLARPLDRRNLSVLIEAFNRFAETAVSVEQVIADAEATGRSYFVTWLETAAMHNPKLGPANFLKLLDPLTTDPSAIKGVLEAILKEYAKDLTASNADPDLADDMAAWRELRRDIAGHIGRNAPLDQFLQELQLRSKEPSPGPDTVTLMTIHAAKGREFDCVYLIGLAEDIIPSFQSKQKGDHSPEMEEERRNCFVAITRTKECLVLSRAKTYKGWPKQVSRLLIEMGLINDSPR